MENISIPVPSNIAQAFASASEGVRRKAEVYINAWLSSFFSNRPSNERLFDIMKKATGEAKANGFTPDQLDDLLKNE